ncbi:sugar phosphate isomerase/epimerase family protein [Planctomicrobium sp. SH661]|uniref:sugar phosphate isomerase/epimerase family protein n=1 Tax=Planctomicrobium sp. SH661 TaxID=3448124 RepID=UPI003F5BF17E
MLRRDWVDSRFSRRELLRCMTAGSLALSANPLLRAAEPIQRSGEPFFKLSLAAYSFRQRLTRGWPTPTGKSGTMSLYQFLDFCANQNLDGAELTSYYFPNPLATPELLKIKEYAFRLGLSLSGTAIGNDFCLPDGPAREDELSLCRQWIDYAASMGAPVIRIFAGKVPLGSTEEQAVAQCVKGIEESLKYASEKGVVLALENHGGITSTADGLLRIVKQVSPSPWFGVNFDSGNFHTADPYEDLEKIAPYAVNAQIKVTMSAKGQDAKRSDYKRIISILKQAGYRGYLVLEYEESADPYQTIPGELRQLRDLIAMT